MENKFCAVITSHCQVSPDDWEKVTNILEVNPGTTVKQIADWYKSHHPRDTRINVTITNLEQTQ